MGLIGHTKGDALETITHLRGGCRGRHPAASVGGCDADVLDLLEERGVPFTTWEGWLALDAHERALGEAFQPTGSRPVVRERVKVVSRDEQVEISRSGALIDS